MTPPGRPAAYLQQAPASPVPAVMTSASRQGGWPELEIYGSTAGKQRHDADLAELTRAIASGRHDALPSTLPRASTEARTPHVHARGKPAGEHSIGLPAGSAHDRS